MDDLMTEICEMDEADPDHERTACVNYDDLYELVKRHFEAPKSQN